MTTRESGGAAPNRVTQDGSPEASHNASATRPPDPNALAALVPSDRLGAAYLLLAVTLTLGALVLSLNDAIGVWLCGQLLLAVALLQWFAILHEAGHKTLFRSSWPNVLTGHLAGFFSGIPFPAWKRVHAVHHRWTGWQDRDVTTARLVPRTLRWWERAAINTCWVVWFPLFAILYRTGNYWNPPLLRAVARGPREARRLTRSVWGQLAVYAIVFGSLTAGLGIAGLLQLLGLSLWLTLSAQDLIILSQHTHVPMRQSRGRNVRPVPPVDQEQFTRSLRFPRWFARGILLNLDAHELHHMYPRLPGYRLHRIAYVPRNRISWWRWVWRARRIPADVLLFQNRDQTGYRV